MFSQPYVGDIMRIIPLPRVLQLDPVGADRYRITLKIRDPTLNSNGVTSNTYQPVHGSSFGAIFVLEPTIYSYLYTVRLSKQRIISQAILTT
jgi:hypothetical protein